MNFLTSELAGSNDAVLCAILILVISILHDAQFGDLFMYYSWCLFATKILTYAKQ